MTKPPPPPWPETLATVTACEYQFGSLSVMAFGIPDRDHFRISFTYQAGRRTCTGHFSSPVAIPQGGTFRLTYNPLLPQENSKSHRNPH